MSFRGKVKAVLRVNESERLRRRDQAHGLQGEDAWMKKWNALSDAEKKALRRQSKKKAKKVKQRVEEAKKVTVDQAHKIARERAKKIKFKQPTAEQIASARERDRKADAVRAANRKKVKKGTTPESTNEDSDHPFYQKVKELSRGKKNKSLLEKKSNSVKTFKILLGTIGKKSKTDEGVGPFGGGLEYEQQRAKLLRNKRKSKTNDEKMDEGKREQATKKRRDIAKKTEARRKQRATEERRAREAQSELVKKGRRSDQEPNSPGHDATHGDSESRKTGNDTLNDLAKKLGIGGPFF